MLLKGSMGCFKRIREIPKSLDIVTLIHWRDATVTGDLLLDIVYLHWREHYLLEELEQNFVARSSAEAKYRAMVIATS